MTAAGAGDAIWGRIHRLASQLAGGRRRHRPVRAAARRSAVDLADREQPGAPPCGPRWSSTPTSRARFDAALEVLPAPAAGRRRAGRAPGPGCRCGFRSRCGPGAGRAQAHGGRGGHRAGAAARRGGRRPPRRLRAGARTERYHVYRVLRAVELAHLLHDALRRARSGATIPSRAEVAACIEALR